MQIINSLTSGTAVASSSHTAPQAFEAIHQIAFNSLEAYNKFKEEITRQGLSQFKLQFQDRELKVLSGHAIAEFFALTDKLGVNTLFFDTKHYGSYGSSLGLSDDLYSASTRKVEASFSTIDKKNYPSPKEFIDKATTELQKFKDVDINFFPHDPLTQKNYLETIYSRFNGIVFGEDDHSSKRSKQFLMSQLEKMQSLGVKTLFLEHIPRNTLQNDLDEFHLKGTMSLCLEAYLDSLFTTRSPFGSNEGSGFKDLVIEAQKRGIKVSAIDTEFTYGFETREARYLSRIVAMNFMAKQIIESTLEKDSKFAVFVGRSHVCRCTSPRTTVAGLSEILKVPNVLLSRYANTEKSNIRDFVIDDETLDFFHLQIPVGK
jgi:hypothetical protein